MPANLTWANLTWANLTWAVRMRNLRDALGRDPTLAEMLEVAPLHRMTADEYQAQRESWARAMAPCEHGIRDWEQCEECGRAAGGDDAG
jgi:hypothetical protein